MRDNFFIKEDYLIYYIRNFKSTNVLYKKNVYVRYKKCAMRVLIDISGL